MGQIVYSCGGAELIEAVKPYWEKLAEHHYRKTVYFKEYFAVPDYSYRRNGFLKKAAEGQLRIEFARDSDSGAVAGYCASSLDAELKGEVDSLYVAPEYRKRGIGEQLMKNALAWLDECGAKKKEIDVAFGNDEVLPFYQKFGFYPRRYRLEQKNNI